MAIDFTRNVVYKVKSDTTQAKAGFTDLGRAVDNVSLEMAELGKESAEARSFLEKLGATGSDVMDKMHAAAQTASGGWKAFGNGIESVTKFMHPLNGSIELASKAIGFLGDGLDEYAKKSPAAAKEVDVLTKRLGGLKHEALAWVGEMTIAVDKFLFGTANGLSTIGQMMRQLQQGWTPGGGVAAFRAGFDQRQRQGAAAGLETLLGGGLLESIKAVMPKGSSFDQSPEELLNQFAAKMKSDYEKQQKAFAEASKRATATPGKFSDVATIGGTDTAGAPIGFGSTLYAQALAAANPMASGNLDASNQATSAALYEAELERMKSLTADWMAELDATTQRRQGLLEAVFGPIEKFDLYQDMFKTLGGVFSAFTDAVGASYEAIVTGQGSVSAAFKKMFADSIMATGKASAIDAVRETALGFASLALGPIGGASAGAHFTAAGFHAATAAAAGAAAHAIGTSAQANAKAATAAQATKESSSAGSASTGGRSTSSSSNDNSSRPIYVIVGDHWDDLTPRVRRQRAQDQVERALRERDA